jgi:hypothetical protein
MLLFVLGKCFDAFKVAARIYSLSSPPYILSIAFLQVRRFTSLSYYTSLIILNVADHEDTTYHIEKSEIICQSVDN